MQTDLKQAIAALETVTEVMVLLPICRTALLLLDVKRNTEALYEEIDNLPEEDATGQQSLYDLLSEYSIEADRLNDELDAQAQNLIVGPQEHAAGYW